jgi:hypothetical protein
MEKTIPITMLLRSEARNAEAIAKVQKIASDLGLTPTTTGKVSLCFRVSEEKCQELFGQTPRPVSKKGPSKTDAGTSGGFVETDLAIPVTLVPFVETITVTAPATRLK